MESLTSIESFVRSAELNSFSAAARRLGLTPAAVSKNVAKLEADLGVRLFHRSTRRLVLTEVGERFLSDVSGGLGSIQSAIANVTSSDGKPAGTLKVTMPPALGRDYLMPYLGAFMAQYPGIIPDWHFDSRQVDLIGEGFDVAIGGNIDLVPGVIARELARVRVIAVASPGYMIGKKAPKRPADLARYAGIVRRNSQTGRTRVWMLNNTAGEQEAAELTPRLVVSDPEASCRAAVLGLGVTLAPVALALPHLEKGELVRILPKWSADAGPLSLYFAGSGKLMSPKTRVFVDYLVSSCKRDRLAERLSCDDAG